VARVLDGPCVPGGNMKKARRKGRRASSIGDSGLPGLLPPQQLTQLWLFFAPIPSSSAIVAGKGEMR
jgi:hypothetical protein